MLWQDKKKTESDPDEAMQEIKKLTRIQPEVNIVATHRILTFLNNLSKSFFWTSVENQVKIRDEFVHYILRSKIGSIESGFSMPTGKELKKLMDTYTFLVEHVYEIYGVLDDDGTLFLDSESDQLIIKKLPFQSQKIMSGSKTLSFRNNQNTRNRSLTSARIFTQDDDHLLIDELKKLKETVVNLKKNLEIEKKQHQKNKVKIKEI